MFQFKKVIFIFVVSLVFGLVSCSKDDNTVNTPYTPGTTTFSQSVKATLSGSLSGSFSSTITTSHGISGVRTISSMSVNPYDQSSKTLQLVFPDELQVNNTFTVGSSNQLAIASVSGGSTVPVNYRMKEGKITITAVTDSTFSGTFEGVTQETQGQDGYLRITNGTFSLKK